MVVYTYEKLENHDDVVVFQIKRSADPDSETIATADVLQSPINTYHMTECQMYKKFTIDDMRHTIYISWLSTTSTERNKYYATKLLYYIFRHFYSLGYKFITLRDASDRANKPSCIYRQIGLRYLKEGECVMIGNLRHILYGSNRGLNGRNTDPDVFYKNGERRSKNLARQIAKRAEKDKQAVQNVQGERVDGTV